MVIDDSSLPELAKKQYEEHHGLKICRICRRSISGKAQQLSKDMEILILYGLTVEKLLNTRPSFQNIGIFVLNIFFLHLLKWKTKLKIKNYFEKCTRQHS